MDNKNINLNQTSLHRKNNNKNILKINTVNLSNIRKI